MQKREVRLPMAQRRICNGRWAGPHRSRAVGLKVDVLVNPHRGRHFELRVGRVIRLVFEEAYTVFCVSVFSGLRVRNNSCTPLHNPKAEKPLCDLTPRRASSCMESDPLGKRLAHGVFSRYLKQTVTMFLAQRSEKFYFVFEYNFLWIGSIQRHPCCHT